MFIRYTRIALLAAPGPGYDSTKLCTCRHCRVCYAAVATAAADIVWMTWRVKLCLNSSQVRNLRFDQESFHKIGGSSSRQLQFIFPAQKEFERHRFFPLGLQLLCKYPPTSEWNDRENSFKQENFNLVYYLSKSMYGQFTGNLFWLVTRLSRIQSLVKMDEKKVFVL